MTRKSIRTALSCCVYAPSGAGRAESLGDLDVENFPTILVRRQQWVLFFGTMLPQVMHLHRLLETFLDQTSEQSREYAYSSSEHRSWQVAELTDIAKEHCSG